MEASPSFGYGIKRLRKALDLTQEALAHCAGCSIMTIRKIEAGDRRPSKQLGERLAECLHIAPPQRALFLKESRTGVPGATLLDPTRPIPLLPSHLPTLPTTLIGREQEIAQITTLLQQEEVRLVTITGPGGIGKTHLALKVAETQLEHFAREVYFVPLTPLLSAELLVATIAVTLRFSFQGSRDQKIQLLTYLHEKKILLILDGFEHVQAGASLIAEILRQAPATTLLVTSRERLHTQGEWVLDLAGLSFPHTDQIEEEQRYSAMQFFLHCAHRHNAPVPPSAEEMRAVGRICQLVEGMPLALELAAAWTRTLSCRDIAHELEQGLTLLTTTSSTVPERHRSILVVCEHSWNLLTAEEQAVFRRLSVFHGGFRRSAAEQIAGATLPILAALIDKSLLRKCVVEGYEMHDLLRQYTAVKLQERAEEQDAACDRHCRYYTDMLFQREEHLRGKRQDEALEEIRADMENVRFAWHWAVIHRRLAAIGRAQQGLSDVYEILGWFEEGAALFGQAAEQFEGERQETEETEEERVVRGHLYARQGWFCLVSGQYERAQTVVHKSLALLHGADRGEALLFPLTSLGMLAYLKGDYTGARQQFEENLKLQRSLGNTWGEGWALGHVGMVLSAQGQMQEAEALIQEALVRSQALGDRRLTALCLGFLSQVIALLGNAARAHALAQESYELCKDIGYLWGMASALSHLGTAAALMGEDEQAQHWYQESLEGFSIIGDPWGRANTLTDLAQESCALGASQQAIQYALEAAELALKAQLLPILLELLVVLARILSQGGNAPLAVEVLGLPLHHAASHHETNDKAHQLLLLLSAHLAPDVLTTIEDHWLEGTPEEGLKKAMEFLQGGESPPRFM